MAAFWLDRAAVSGDLHGWLSAGGSLSWRIQARCSRFKVQRVRQERARPWRDEAGLLGLTPSRHALVREVVLQCGEVPVVFAHSIARPESLNGPWRGLRKLGSRPLANVLYQDPLIERRPLQFRKLSERHPLYRRAQKVLGPLPAELWARRSVFVRDRQPLLVTELFLPAILGLHGTPT